jgi:hypothetical protein
MKNDSGKIKGGRIPEAVASMIRQWSEAGDLISEAEILLRATDQNVLTSQAGDAVEQGRKMLQEVVSGAEDLREVRCHDGSRLYYSSRFMTDVYAGILLQRAGDPLQLIADIVRHNSEVYPRPLPLDFFTQPPLSLSHQEVLDALEEMSAQTDYGDIAPTTTSASRLFLFSTLHLDPEYASMLAEWLDVGQHENP